MDEFTEMRYSRIADWYIDILEKEGTRAAINMVWDQISSSNEIKEKFIPFLKEHARKRGYYV